MSSSDHSRMGITTRNLCLLAALCVAVAGSWGCASSASFAGSSESISDILSSPFESSSDSSEKMTAYREDVRALTLAYLDAPERSEAFLLGLSQVAEEHGIVDWEGVPSTFVAFGAALRERGIPLAGAEDMGRQLFGEGALVSEGILEAYRS